VQARSRQSVRVRADPSDGAYTCYPSVSTAAAPTRSDTGRSSRRWRFRAHRVDHRIEAWLRSARRGALPATVARSREDEHPVTVITCRSDSESTKLTAGVATTRYFSGSAEENHRVVRRPSDTSTWASRGTTRFCCSHLSKRQCRGAADTAYHHLLRVNVPGSRSWRPINPVRLRADPARRWRTTRSSASSRDPSTTWHIGRVESHWRDELKPRPHLYFNGRANGLEDAPYELYKDYL